MFNNKAVLCVFVSSNTGITHICHIRKLTQMRCFLWVGKLDFTFCSLWYLTERKDPRTIGIKAMITKLLYATNIPSGVDGILAVPFAAVAFKVSFKTGNGASVSAMLTIFVDCKVGLIVDWKTLEISIRHLILILTSVWSTSPCFRLTGLPYVSQNY